jgi:hypothetical protein
MPLTVAIPYFLSKGEHKMKAFYFIPLFLMLIAGNVLAGDYYSTSTEDDFDLRGNILNKDPDEDLHDTDTGQYYYKTPSGDYSNFKGGTLNKDPSGNLRDTKTGQYYYKTPSGDYSNFKGGTLNKDPSGNLRKSNWK